jgi:anti-sigma B factor antagonist
MFDIKAGKNKTLHLSGRFDASQAENARKKFNEIHETTIIDFSDLEYISSAGLGILLMTQKRLVAKNQKLKLVGMNNHVREIFRYARFDVIFDIE